MRDIKYTINTIQKGALLEFVDLIDDIWKMEYYSDSDWSSYIDNLRGYI